MVINTRVLGETNSKLAKKGQTGTGRCGWGPVPCSEARADRALPCPLWPRSSCTSGADTRTRACARVTLRFPAKGQDAGRFAGPRGPTGTRRLLQLRVDQNRPEPTGTGSEPTRTGGPTRATAGSFPPSGPGPPGPARPGGGTGPGRRRRGLETRRVRLALAWELTSRHTGENPPVPGGSAAVRVGAEPEGASVPVPVSVPVSGGGGRGRFRAGGERVFLLNGGFARTKWRFPDGVSP